MIRPRLTALTADLPATVPFVGPEAQQRASGRPFKARIGANESGFGPSPAVQAAIAATAGEVWMYGDAESYDLRQTLSRKLGIDSGNIVVGEGIDGLLGLTVRLFAEPGSAVVTSLGAYPTFNYHVAGFGARLVTVPYEHDRESLSGLLDAVRREKAPLVYLANPDNPMGTWWEASEVIRFIDELPETTMLVLDEAYGEMAPAGTLPPLDISRPNVIRMRTFSKAYGLAGLRCGYAIGETDTIRAFEKVRNHFGMTRVAQVAALAAVADEDYLQSVIRQVGDCRERLIGIAASNGLRALPSATNFVAIDAGADGPTAMRLMNALLARDIFVRKPMAPGLDRCIRVSVGPASEIDVFAASLPAALAEARG